MNTSINTRTRTGRLLSRFAHPAGAAAILACAGLAGAAQSGGGGSGGGGGGGAGAPQARSTVESVAVQTVTLRSGEGTVEVRVVEGDVFLKVNGEQRPSRRLDGDWVRFPVVIDGQSKPIATVVKDSSGAGVIVMSGSPSDEEIERHRQTYEPSRSGAAAARAIGAEAVRAIKGVGAEALAEIGREFEIDLSGDISADVLRQIEEMLMRGENHLPSFAVAGAEAQPKSMIGITMQIEKGADGEWVIVEDVMDGLPAQQAGLRSGDRIVEIETLGRADSQTIRRLTREFEPGRSVTLRVMRDGEEVEKTLVLAPYRGVALRAHSGSTGAGGGWGSGGQQFYSFEFSPQQLAELDAVGAELEAEIAAKQARIEELAAKLSVTGEAEAAAAELQQLARELEAAARRMSERQVRSRVNSNLVEQLRGGGATGGGGVIVGRGEGGQRPMVLTFAQAPVAPPAPLAPPAAPGFTPPSEERISIVESRLDALEASNQRIEAMLEQMLEQMSTR